MFIHSPIEKQKPVGNNLQNALSKPSLTLILLVRELFSFFHYLLRFSGFSDLFGKNFLINLKFPNLIFQSFRGSSVNKTRFWRDLGDYFLSCEARLLYFFFGNLMLRWPWLHLIKTLIIKVLFFLCEFVWLQSLVTKQILRIKSVTRL